LIIENKHIKSDYTIDSEKNLVNIAFNPNVSNIFNQTNNPNKIILNKNGDQILEKDNEVSFVAINNDIKEKAYLKYKFINKLKNSRKNNQINSTKNLKIIDVDSKKTIFKIDENNNLNLGNQPDGQIKCLGRVNKSIKTSLNLMNIEEIISNKDSVKRKDIIQNYVYSVSDFFDNKKYNMERLKLLDFSDLKKIVKDSQHQGVYKRLSILEKKKYLSNLMDIKKKQIEIQNKRIDDIKKEGKNLFCIKIKNCCIGTPNFDLYFQFSDFEIYMAKKCILNNWFLPPPSYYEEKLSKLEEDKTDRSTENISKKY